MRYTAPPPPGKIDVPASLRAACTLVTGNARLAVEFAWLHFAILVIAEIIASIVAGDGMFGENLPMLVRAGGFAVFGTVFIVRWHRFVLLGEKTAAGFFPPGWATFFLTAVKIGVAVFVGIMLLVLIAEAPPYALTALLAVVGYVALVLGSVRVLLAFPAAAIERPISLREAWDQLGGNYWRLFACLLVYYLPFAIVNFIVIVIAGAMPSVLSIAFQIIGLAVWFAGAAVVASLLSEVYRALNPAGAGTERRAS